MMRLLAREREGQTVAVEAQPGVLQTALEQTGVALQGIQGVGPLRRDHGADLIVAMKLEAHLDPTERGGLELDDQAIDPAGQPPWRSARRSGTRARAPPAGRAPARAPDRVGHGPRGSRHLPQRRCSARAKLDRPPPAGQRGGAAGRSEDRDVRPTSLGRRRGHRSGAWRRQRAHARRGRRGPAGSAPAWSDKPDGAVGERRIRCQCDRRHLQARRASSLRLSRAERSHRGERRRSGCARCLGANMARLGQGSGTARPGWSSAFGAETRPGNDASGLAGASCGWALAAVNAAGTWRRSRGWQGRSGRQRIRRRPDAAENSVSAALLTGWLGPQVENQRPEPA